MAIAGGNLIVGSVLGTVGIIAGLLSRRRIKNMLKAILIVPVIMAITTGSVVLISKIGGKA